MMPSDAAKKSQDVGYEVLLHWREYFSVCGIRRKVDLLGSPKGRFVLFVHPTDDGWGRGQNDWGSLAVELN